MASIVVACRNEVRHIREFLDCVLAQDMQNLDWEIIIADGESTDGTREVLDWYAARNPRVHVLNNAARIVSAGLNLAIQEAAGDFILRLDAHTSYSRDYCRLSVEILERTNADNVGGPARTRVSGRLARAIAAAYHSRFSTGGARFHNDNYEGWVDTVPYGCWRKQTLTRLGLFDEQLVRNQDDELNLRITRSGGRIWQTPDIVSWYSPRSTLRSLFCQYFQYGFWKVPVIRKHRIPGSWRHLIPGLFVLTNLGLAVAALTATRGVNLWRNPVAVVWLALVAAYALATTAASTLAARRNGWELLPYLPLVFPVFHMSYGLGFLAGLATYRRGPKAGLNDSVFTRLSR
jgi:succinoglycan biosynthesis protein ExoA